MELLDGWSRILLLNGRTYDEHAEFWPHRLEQTGVASSDGSSSQIEFQPNTIRLISIHFIYCWGSSDKDHNNNLRFRFLVPECLPLIDAVSVKHFE